MGRVYSERIDVQAGEDGQPARFTWRGRLYTVREVTGHWVVNREWWREPAVLPMPAGPGPVRMSGPWTGTGTGTGTGSGTWPGCPELRYYQVEASAGQHLPSGAYELRADVAAGTWTLRRIAD